CAWTSIRTRFSSRARPPTSRCASSSCSNSSSATHPAYTTACSCWTWSGARTCTSSHGPSTCTSAACESGSSEMMPPPNSSSRYAVLDTSSTPTRWSPRLVLQFLVPTLAALTGVLLVAAPWLWVRLGRRQVDALEKRLTTEAALVGEAVPWAEGTQLQDACTTISTAAGLQVMVIGTGGRVLCDSTRTAGSPAPVADEPEVRDAFANGKGH